MIHAKYHCKKCAIAWARWKEPKQICGHAIPTFGCAQCIDYMREKSNWDYFHSDTFKLPKCGECKTTMVLMDGFGPLMEFACPRTSVDGIMICESDSAIAEVRPWPTSEKTP
ncbi:MAG TPA: hypothetical protein DDX89_01020 [Candidatus Omnitrophica bacterium]|nr:hypothetical protein [Candidatus Omnitrophota bacterium]